jgi:hypothetical protein
MIEPRTVDLANLSHKSDNPIQITVTPEMSLSFAEKMAEQLGIRVNDLPERGRIQRVQNELAGLLDGQPLRMYCAYSGKARQGDLSMDFRIATDVDCPANARLINRLGDKSWIWRAAQSAQGRDALQLLGTNGPFGKSRGSVDAWCLVMDVVFDFSAAPSRLPHEILNKIVDLPIYEAQHAEMKKRLTDWQNYLELQKKIALAKEFIVAFKAIRRKERKWRLIIDAQAKESVEWELIQKAKNEQIYLVITEATVKQMMENESENLEDMETTLLGQVVDVLRDKNEVVIEIDDDFYASWQKNPDRMPAKGRICYRAIGELFQFRTLQTGLERLARGQAENSRLADFMFNPGAAQMCPPDEQIHLTDRDLLQPRLNDEQRQAVEGVLNAKDLFLIQGPPGTGKTTVIAEICYQLAQRGMRTLIASQSNLAVDNALSRLVNHSSIRALRRGRAERVEEEGQPFLEENVIERWLQESMENAKNALAHRRQRKTDLAWLIDQLPSLKNLRLSLDDVIRDEQQLLTTRQQLHSTAARIDQLSVDADQLQYAMEIWQARQSQPLADVVNWEGTDGDQVGVDLLPNLSILKEEAMKLSARLSAWGQASFADNLLWTDSLGGVKNIARILQEAQVLLPRLEELLLPLGQLLAMTQQQTEQLRLINQWMEEIQDLEVRRTAGETVERLRREATVYARLASEIALEPHLLASYIAEAVAENIVTISREKSKTDDFSAELSGQQVLQTVLSQGFQPNVTELVERCVTAKEKANEFRGMAGLANALCRSIMPRTVGPVAGVRPWYDSGAMHALFHVYEHGKIRLSPNYRQVFSGIERQVRSDMDRAAQISENSLWAEQEHWYDLLNQLLNLLARLIKQADDEEQGYRLRIEGVIRLTSVAAQPLVVDILVEQERSIQRQIESNYPGSTNGDSKAVLSQEISRLQQTIRITKADVAQTAKKIREQQSSLWFNPLGNILVHKWVGISQESPSAQTLQDVRIRVQQEIKEIGRLIKALDISVIARDMTSALQRRLDSIDADRQSEMANQKRINVHADSIARGLQHKYAIHKEDIREWQVIVSRIPPDLLPAHTGEDGSHTSSESTAHLIAQVLLNAVDWPLQYDRACQELARTESFQESWIQRLSQLVRTDDTDLRRVYIDNANVIGITCVQAGKRDFAEEYRAFDCVVIDEVSKATPPELLLPMLKGKKIVLVGDHRQLPPMIGFNTIKELAEDQHISIDELEHIESSLFKELFEQCEDEKKIMLQTQYRMHPQIMEAINQFYSQKLRSGLSDPDEQRSHGFSTAPFSSDCHIQWLSFPNEPDYFEEARGTSRVNLHEIRVIQKLIEKLDREWQPMVMLQRKEPKEVGIISFYGAQEREIRKRLAPYIERTDTALRLRIGTVDRFQGMERPVVIVSMVCNNDRRSIGFAKEEERVNVAFSRAQELLIIVGSLDMFCLNGPSGRPYQNVASVVRKHNGILSLPGDELLAMP